MNSEIKLLVAEGWQDYELLDTGEGEKLERFCKYFFVRPYEDAVWKKTLSKKEWDNADGKFTTSKSGQKAGWHIKNTEKNKISEKFELQYKDVKFWATPTPFRHLGFFPEQASHWDFITKKISQGRSLRESKDRPLKFLNLFGYTGVASLVALRAGAEVTHVDASKQSLSWLKENQELSGLEELPIRIILEDVMKFIEREEKRGNKYDAIIMDPPKFGRGPKGETWKIEEMLPKLLKQIRRILSDQPLFVIINSYSTNSSALSLGYALEEAMAGLRGSLASAELCILEKSKNRAISLSNTAVWESK